MDTITVIESIGVAAGAYVALSMALYGGLPGFRVLWALTAPLSSRTGYSPYLEQQQLATASIASTRAMLGAFIGPAAPMIAARIELWKQVSDEITGYERLAADSWPGRLGIAIAGLCRFQTEVFFALRYDALQDITAELNAHFNAADGN